MPQLKSRQQSTARRAEGPAPESLKVVRGDQNHWKEKDCLEVPDTNLLSRDQDPGDGLDPGKRDGQDLERERNLDPEINAGRALKGHLKEQEVDHPKEKAKDPGTENVLSLERGANQDQRLVAGQKGGQFPGLKDHPESLEDPGHFQEPRKEAVQGLGRRGVAVPEVRLFPPLLFLLTLPFIMVT